jgi:hypothetical protein
MRKLRVKYIGRVPLPFSISNNGNRLVFNKENNGEVVLDQRLFFNIARSKQLQFEIMEVIREEGCQETCKETCQKTPAQKEVSCQDQAGLKEVRGEGSQSLGVSKVEVAVAPKRKGNPNWIKKTETLA